MLKRKINTQHTTNITISVFLFFNASSFFNKEKNETHKIIAPTRQAVLIVLANSMSAASPTRKVKGVAITVISVKTMMAVILFVMLVVIRFFLSNGMSAVMPTNVFRLRVRFLLCQVTHLSVNTQKMVA